MEVFLIFLGTLVIAETILAILFMRELKIMKETKYKKIQITQDFSDSCKKASRELDESLRKWDDLIKKRDERIKRDNEDSQKRMENIQQVIDDLILLENHLMNMPVEMFIKLTDKEK